MIIQIANVVFDEEQRILKNGDLIRSLEPKVYSLLTTLIAAKKQIVTRDKLITDVWNNRVVGEGAINRTVSILRGHFQALTDEEIIETVPTQGYRLIASVQELTEQTSAVDKKSLSEPPLISSSNHSIKAPINNATEKTKTATAMILFGVLLMLILVYMTNLDEEAPTANRYDLSLVSGPLIGLNGLEYNLSATMSGDVVLFHHLAELNDQSVYLYNTQNHQKTKILTDAIAAISGDGNTVVYATRSEEHCTFATYKVLTEEKRTLFPCEETPSAIVWGEKNTFYFNKRFSKSHPYQIFSYNVATHHLQQISNPSGKNNTKGDFRFSYSHQSDQLAAIRYVDENHSDIIVFQHDKEINKYSVDYRLSSLAWHTDGKSLILADNTNIYALSTESGQAELLKQLAIEINSIATIPNESSTSLLLSNANISSEIVKYDIESGTNSLWQQSGRAELLPRIKADSQFVLSTRYKNHHWWQIKNNEAVLIDVPLPFDLQFVRYELSQSGKRILFSKYGVIYELDLETKENKQLFSDHQSSYVANYDSQNNNNVIYSSNHSGQWQLWLYEKEKNTHKQLTFNGGYSGRVDGEYLYFTKYAVDGLWRKSLSGASEQSIIEDFNRINWLNWRIINQQLYFYREGLGILQYNLNTGEERVLMKEPKDFVHQYTITPDQQNVLWVRLKPLEGDIYQYNLH